MAVHFNEDTLFNSTKVYAVGFKKHTTPKKAFKGTANRQFQAVNRHW